MSEKVEFSGDVGQAVMGDVKEAPRLSNVVNLNLSEAKKEVQLITDYQRKRIKLLVKEWATICGDKEIEIYKVFIADFGIRYFRELPMDHYLSVKGTLEGWIAGAAKAATAPPAEIVGEKTQVTQAHCGVCADTLAALAHSRRAGFAQWLLIAILAACSTWLVYKTSVARDGDQQAESRCYFEGKAYSVGSTVRNVTGALQECATGMPNSEGKWVAVRKTR